MNQEKEFKINEAVSKKTEQERMEESLNLKSEIESITTIDELLDRAEMLAPRANTLRIDYTDSANAFIVEARRRLELMTNEDEKARIQNRLDAAYGKYIEAGNL